MTTLIETERLYLRTWKALDAIPFFEINQNRQVIEFLLGPMTLGAVNLIIEYNPNLSHVLFYAIDFYEFFDSCVHYNSVAEGYDSLINGFHNFSKF